MLTKSNLPWYLKQSLLLILVFTIFRTISLLTISCNEDFNWSWVWIIYYTGVRFDLLTLAFLSLPFLILCFMVKLFNLSLSTLAIGSRVWLVLVWLLLLSLCWINLKSVLLNNEFLQSDFNWQLLFLKEFWFTSYPFSFWFGSFISILIFLFSLKIKVKILTLPSYLSLAVLTIFVFLAARGTVTPHHLFTEHTRVTPSSCYNQLTVNPLWSLDKKLD